MQGGMSMGPQGMHGQMVAGGSPIQMAMQQIGFLLQSQRLIALLKKEKVSSAYNFAITQLQSHGIPVQGAHIDALKSVLCLVLTSIGKAELAGAVQQIGQAGGGKDGKGKDGKGKDGKCKDKDKGKKDKDKGKGKKGKDDDSDDDLPPANAYMPQQGDPYAQFGGVQGAYAMQMGGMNQGMPMSGGMQSPMGGYQGGM